MGMRGRRGLLSLAVVCLVALSLFWLAGCGGGGKDEKTASPKETGKAEPAGKGVAAGLELKLYDGPPTGMWRAIAVSVQQSLQEKVPGLKVSLEPGGGASNVIAVDKGPAMAMAMTNAIYDGYVGNPPYEKKTTNIREVAVLFPMYSSVAVLANSGITKVEDLKGKRVQVNPKGYASELINQMVFKQYGMSYQDISPQFLGETEGADALKDGHVDAIMTVSVTPYPPYLDVMASRKVRIFGYTDQVLKGLLQNNKGLIPSSIPAGTYQGYNEPILALNAPTVLIANKDVPDDLVEKMVNVLADTFEDRQKMFDFTRGLKKEELALDIGIPFHPGAEKVYRAKGWLK